MSKRPLPSSGNGDYMGSHENHSKRHQTSRPRHHANGALKLDAADAVLCLTENADDLIAYLQALKRDQTLSRNGNTASSQAPTTQDGLYRLSKKLLPSFQTLASFGPESSQKSSTQPRDNHRQSEPNATQAPQNNPSSTKIAVSVPASFVLTPWVSSEIPMGLPSPPEILDPELEKAVFTHPGLHQRVSYERLEWVGDAYVELIASNLISQTFTRSAVGRCSQLREILIRNTTLAGYFRQYDLTKRAMIPPDLGSATSSGRGRSKDKDPIKIQADMFEAFVAAAIISDPQNGLANTSSWLKTLFGQTIKRQIMENETTIVQDINPKDQLRAMIGAKGIHIEYADMPGGGKDANLGLPLYNVGVYLNGWGEEHKFLGMGTALKKQEAGKIAAAKALENKELLRVYEGKKIAFKEAAEAAEAAARAAGDVSTA